MILLSIAGKGELYMSEAKFLQGLVDRTLTNDELKIMEEAGSLYPHIVAPERFDDNKEITFLHTQQVAMSCRIGD